MVNMSYEGNNTGGRAHSTLGERLLDFCRGGGIRDELPRCVGDKSARAGLSMARLAERYTHPG
jgi:hypothetical protein